MHFANAGLAIACVSLLACGASKNGQKRMEEKQPEAPWSISYYDGSANGFRFHLDDGAKAARFEYSPTRPETSSSGVYSGGEAKQGDLSAAQVGELWQRVEKLAADTSLHASTRKMGTGLVKLSSAGAERSFILDTGPALDELNSFVAQFRDD